MKEDEKERKKNRRFCFFCLSYCLMLPFIVI